MLDRAAPRPEDIPNIPILGVWQLVAQLIFGSEILQNEQGKSIILSSQPPLSALVGTSKRGQLGLKPKLNNISTTHIPQTVSTPALI